MERKRIQPINPGAPANLDPGPSALPTLPGFGKPINLVGRVAPRAIQPFGSMGRRLRDPNAIPIDRPVPMAPPIEPETFPLADEPGAIPVDEHLGATPSDQRMSKFGEPAATPRPAPGAYNAVKNAARGPALPFAKPGTALAPIAPAGPPAVIPGRPAIPMGGPQAPAPAPVQQGALPPAPAQGQLPAPGPATKPIPMGGPNAYTPPNAGGTAEAIGGATPNRTGKFAGALRPPPANGFNLVREPLGLPGPPRPAPAAAPPPPPPIDPFDVRTAQRGGTFSRAGVQTPGSLRQQMGVAPPLRPVAPASRLMGAAKTYGPMLAVSAAADPEGFAHSLGHPVEAMGDMIRSGADGIKGLFDGRFRAGLGRLGSGDPEAWKYAAANAPVASQIFHAGANIGEGGAAFLLNPSEASASFGRGLSKIGEAFSGPTPSAPATPQAPELNPNGLTPEFMAHVQAAGGNPANYGMAGGQLVSMPGTTPPAPQAPQPGPGASADQLNAFWNGQGVGPGEKAMAPAPQAPAVAQAPAAPSNIPAVAAGSPEARQAMVAQRTMGLLTRQMTGLQAQFDRYQNPEMRAGIASQMANLGHAIAQQQQVATQLGTAPSERRLMEARATAAEQANRPPGEKLAAIMQDPKSYEAYLISNGVKPDELPALMDRYRANQQASGGRPNGPIDQQSYAHVLRGDPYLEGLRPQFDPTHAGYNPKANLTDILDRAMTYPGAADPNSPVSQVIREGVRARYPGETLMDQVAQFRNNPRNWFGDSARDAKYRNYLRSIGLSEVPAQ